MIDLYQCACNHSNQSEDRLQKQQTVIKGFVTDPMMRAPVYNDYFHSNYFVKSNCLKLKSEVGMAVLKSKQTRVVGIISTYILHPYACITRQSV